MASAVKETKQLKVECDETALDLFHRCCMPALVTGIQMLDAVGVIANQQPQVLGIEITAFPVFADFVICVVNLLVVAALKHTFPNRMEDSWLEQL